MIWNLVSGMVSPSYDALTCCMQDFHMYVFGKVSIKEELLNLPL